MAKQQEKIDLSFMDGASAQVVDLGFMEESATDTGQGKSRWIKELPGALIDGSPFLQNIAKAWLFSKGGNFPTDFSIPKLVSSVGRQVNELGELSGMPNLSFIYENAKKTGDFRPPDGPYKSVMAGVAAGSTPDNIIMENGTGVAGAALNIGKGMVSFIPEFMAEFAADPLGTIQNRPIDTLLIIDSVGGARLKARAKNAIAEYKRGALTTGDLEQIAKEFGKEMAGKQQSFYTASSGPASYRPDVPDAFGPIGGRDVYATGLGPRMVNGPGIPEEAPFIAARQRPVPVGPVEGVKVAEQPGVPEFGKLRPPYPAEAHVKGPYVEWKDRAAPESPAPPPVPKAEPVVPKPVAATGAKEPWQMTKGEFVADYRARESASIAELENQLRSGGYPKSEMTPYGQKALSETEAIKRAAENLERARKNKPDWWYEEDVPASHQKAIKEALAEGKPVPPEVLADYPDLASTAPAPRPAGNPVPPGMTREEFMRASADDIEAAWKGREIKGLGVQMVDDAGRPISAAEFYGKRGGQTAADSVNKLARGIADRSIPIHKEDRPAAFLGAKKIEAALRENSPAEKNFILGLSVDKNFERMGPEGARIATAGRNFDFQHHSGTAQDVTRLVAANIQAKRAMPSLKATNSTMDEAIHARLASIIEKRAQAVSPAEQQAADSLRGIFKKFEAEIAELRAKGIDVTIDTPNGPKPWAPVENYYPRVYENLKEVVESSATRQRLIETIAKKDPTLAAEFANPATRGAALERAEALLNNRLHSTLRSKKYGHLEKSRVLSDEVMTALEQEGILKRKYGSDVITGYIDDMNRRISWLRNFGPDIGGVKGMPKLLSEALPKLNDANQAYATDFFKHYLDKNQITPGMKSAYGALSKFQNLKLLWSGIPNSWQWLTNTLPKTPLQDIPKVMADTIRSYKKGSEASAFLDKAGTKLLSGDLQRALLDDPSKASIASDLFMSIIGFKGSESWNSRFATFAGRETANTMAERIIRNPNARRTMAREDVLRHLGISDATIAKMKTAGTNIADIEELAKAGYMMKRWTQFVNDEFALPSIFQRQVLGPALKFKNFPYNQSVTWLGGEILKPAVDFFKSGGKRGDISQVLKAIPAVIVAGGAVTELKKYLQGKIGLTTYADIMDDGDIWKRMGLYVLNTGNLGIVTDMLLATSGSRMLRTIGGPTVGDLTAIVDGVSKAKKEFFNALEVKNPKYLVDRRKKIAHYMLSAGEKILPETKPFINWFFKEYAVIHDATKWQNVYQSVREKYKLNMAYGRGDEAEQIWDAFMRTQGSEYADLFHRLPKKPTIKESMEWAEENQLFPGERMVK